MGPRRVPAEVEALPGYQSALWTPDVGCVGHAIAAGASTAAERQRWIPPQRPNRPKRPKRRHLQSPRPCPSCIFHSSHPWLLNPRVLPSSFFIPLPLPWVTGEACARRLWRCRIARARRPQQAANSRLPRTPQPRACTAAMSGSNRISVAISLRRPDSEDAGHDSAPRCSRVQCLCRTSWSTRQ